MVYCMLSIATDNRRGLNSDCWLVPAQNITTLSTWLRVLNFADYSMSVLRQMPPLPAVPQPTSGHSLAFYIVAGKFAHSSL